MRPPFRRAVDSQAPAWTPPIPPTHPAALVLHPHALPSRSAPLSPPASPYRLREWTVPGVVALPPAETLRVSLQYIICNVTVGRGVGHVEEYTAQLYDCG